MSHKKKNITINISGLIDEKIKRILNEPKSFDQKIYRPSISFKKIH